MSDKTDIVEHISRLERGLRDQDPVLADAFCDAALTIVGLRGENAGKASYIDELRSESADASAEIARLRTVNAELRSALTALVDHDASYHGNKIHIECDSHSDAIGRMHRARALLAGNGKG